MAHPFDHARSSARRFGGEPEDYLHIHSWFDQTKGTWADSRHRAILHNSFGIFLCEQMFGITFKRKSDGVEVRTRYVGEQHVVEDCGFIPSVENWLDELPRKDWMIRGAKPMQRILDNFEKANAEGAMSEADVRKELLTRIPLWGGA